MDSQRNVRETSPTNSETCKEQGSPQHVEKSSQTISPPPHLILPPSRPSPRQGGSPSRGSLGGLGGTPPHGMYAITIGGGGGGGSAIGSADGVILDGINTKRVRELNENFLIGGDESEGNDQFKCNLCNKEFGSNKSLFGHMKTYTDSIPPTFSRQEFVDIGLLNPEGGEEGKRGQEVEQIVLPQALEGTRQYRVPDLNLPPPKEDYGSSNCNDN
ncbi:hypothetical protein M9H77_05208 [Catharanthus roseus]|uniref:Uncharacterized protein n=1 Tax=Catharanthus roseus TaxID=4058 RepID=A0ACC0CGD7_CATRO|nr:hypothetical protein M9H77_05208 [Catharanthus roseus]